MKKKKCFKCGKIYPENKKYFRKYNFKHRDEYCDLCLDCDEYLYAKDEGVRQKREKSVKNDLSAKDWEDCLEFFSYKDAYTGAELTRPSMDHVIPIAQHGDTTRQNIVPCNLEVNISKNDKHMIYWFKAQDFFSNERLKKILEWMGDYSKYLYIPIEQREYIDVTKSKSIYHYTITLPDGSKKRLYYSNNGNHKKRTLTIKKIILDKWEDYFNNNWIYQGKVDPFTINGEDKTKSTLNRCAGFIVAKDKSIKNRVLDKRKIDRAYKNEVPLSSTPSDIQDGVYGINTNTDCYGYSGKGFAEIDYKGKRLKMNPKKWGDTKTYRINKLYGDLINPNKPYIAEWCLVDTNNIFEFQGNTYKIHDEVVQYKPRVKKIRYDDYRSDYKMDKILVFEQDDHQYFFDQHIDRIDNELIKTTGGILNYE